MILPQFLKEMEDSPSFLSATVAVILLLLLLPALLKIFYFPNKTQPNLNLPPGPPKLPIIGNLHNLHGMSPHRSLHRLSTIFGPIIHLNLGQIPTVVVSSPKMAERVLRTHDLALASRPRLFSAKHLFYDCTDITFAPYNDYWRKARKMCIHELLSAKQVESYRYVREDEVARLVGRVRPSVPTNVTKMVRLYANNILCRVALGKDFSAEGEFDRHGFGKMLDEYQALLGGFSMGDFFPWMELVHRITGVKWRLEKTFRRFDGFFDEVIEEHLCGERDTEHKDLVDVLLDVHKNGSRDMEPISIDNVKAIILDMFAAGTDTTFITLDWGMTELIRHPGVMAKAQTEIRNKVGKHRTVITETDLPELHYLRCVIKEILRLHPPVPLLVPRESMEDVRIEGYDIPTKTRIFVNVWAIGRDRESWENPESFEPRRFLGRDIDFKGKDFELIPFGTGRRGCPGIGFGIAMVELALAQLLYTYDWEVPEGRRVEEMDMTEAFGISMHKIADLILVAKPHFD